MTYKLSGRLVKELHTNVMMERLAEGWDTSHAGLAQEFVQRWAGALCTEAEVNEVGENTAQFFLDLSDVRLRTMHEVPCMLVSGSANLDQPLRAFWNKFNSSNHLPFILALSDAAHAEAVRTLKSDRRLLLSAAQVRQMLRAAPAQNLLKQIITRQIPRRTLNPYDLLGPAEGGMFFGREPELSRLRDEDMTSFAIAGPGRIGKTSLAMRYRKEMLRTAPQRATRMIFHSMYEPNPLPSKTARTIAMCIENSSRSDRMVAGDLLNFLRYQKNRYGGTLELLLDEVDEVCQGETFKVLGEAARSKLCRLILCGKGVLLKMMLSSKSPLDCRLSLIPLEPLDENSARDLLIKPLTDLGFTLVNPERLAGEVSELTGRISNLVQLFGDQLAIKAIEGKTDTITTETLESLKADFYIAQTFMKAFNDLDDPEARLVALSLLNAEVEEVSVAEVQAVARSEGIRMDLKRANDVCIDLLINSVLTWKNGEYCIASKGLSFYARKGGYLGSALQDARDKLKGSQQH